MVILQIHKIQNVDIIKCQWVSKVLNWNSQFEEQPHTTKKKKKGKKEVPVFNTSPREMW